MGIFHSYVSLPEGNRFRSHITLSGLWPNSVAICIIHLHCQEVGLLPSWHVAAKLRSRSSKFFHFLFGLETCGVDMEKKSWNHSPVRHCCWFYDANEVTLGDIGGRSSGQSLQDVLLLWPLWAYQSHIWWDNIAATFSSFLLHTFQANKLDKFVGDLFPPQNHPQQQDMNPNMVPSE